MRLLSACLLLALMVPLWAGEAATWMQRIRPDHPRLFINQDLLPLVRANAAGPLAAHYRQIAERCDRFLANPDIQFHVYECTLPELMLVHLVSGEAKYKEKALWVLRQGSRHVRTAFQKKKAVSWFSFARIALFMGYDWLHADLAPDERRAIATDLIANVRELLASAAGGKIEGENYFGFPDGGFYGVRNLKWFAGLAFHQEGVADDEMRRWLEEGLADYRELAKLRGSSVGDDGGMSAVSLGYVFGAYPRAEWNLIHTWRSAIGGNIAPDHAYLANLVNWLVWRTINAGDQGMLCHESGDEYHTTNQQNLSNTHLAQIQYFFADSHPEQARVAAFLRRLNRKADFSGFHFEPIYPLLLDWSRFDPAVFKPLGPDDSWAKARHFEWLGEFHLRSGFGPDDTYCLFKAGNRGAGHTHKDENGFSIYKRGFLAMDTGTRDKTSQTHITEYYAQTIAHNAVLITMPGEKFQHHWGFVPKRNGGGQNADAGTEIRAFTTNDHYTYISSDATRVYNEKKARLVNRQFLFLHPDHFVIIDRVSSVQAEFGKTWLLHTQNQPQLEDRTLRADHGEGRIFVRTLLPAEANLEVVGGPGREYLVEGIPHPISKGWFVEQRKKGTADPLVGHWRLEVRPAKPANDDLFVHVIEVGAAKSLAAMHACSADTSGGKLRIAVDLGDGRTAELDLNPSDPVRGRLLIRRGKTTILDEKLADTVLRQSTLRGRE